MYAVALKNFRDKKKGKFRRKGDEFEVSPERFEEIRYNGLKAGMGIVIEEVVREPFVPDKPKRKGRPTKAELLAEAKALGIEVPEKATNPEIYALIKEAR